MLFTAAASRVDAPERPTRASFSMRSPHTPQNDPRGRTEPLRRISAGFFQKVRVGNLAKPVDRCAAARKSLMLERNRSTAFRFFPRVGFHLPRLCRFVPHATSASLLCNSLFNFLKKKKKRESTEGHIRILSSTEIDICLKNSPRVLWTDPPVPVDRLRRKNNNFGSITGSSTDPHGISPHLLRISFFLRNYFNLRTCYGRP